ncbi:MAG: LytR/AlgR family response regulator transcription factor [Flavobacterium sp.]
MEQRYLILDDDSKNTVKIRSLLSDFHNFVFVGAASTFQKGLDLVLETLPDIVFLEIEPEDQSSGLSLSFISECHRLLLKVPVFITYSTSQDLALQALRYGAIDFLPKPFEASDFRRAWFRYAKEQQILLPTPKEFTYSNVEDAEETLEESDSKVYPETANENLALSWEPVLNEIRSLKAALLQFSSQVPTMSIDTESLTQKITNSLKEVLPTSLTSELQNTLQQLNQSTFPHEPTERSAAVPQGRSVICIKSYGDYRFLELNEIAFLKADNNSTDITLSNGELITAFKTLKYFEESLPGNFYRIHNSYMVNRDFISRIHTGNSECYIKDSKTKLPFSKGYKEKVEQIIEFLAGSDFKEA